MAAHRLLKRKGGVDDISDDFSDISLSSPATKIRRLVVHTITTPSYPYLLDAELPPIVEEEEPALPVTVTVPNEERALVLFKPIPHSLSLTLNSDLLSQIKNQLPWSNQRDSDWDRLVGSQEEDEQDNHRLALVPWVPQPSPSSHCSASDNNGYSEDLMEEADEMGGGEGGASSMMMMDVEEQDTTSNSSSISTVYDPTTPLNVQHQGITATTVPEGFQHQQHCLLPQFLQNTSTPITWTR